MSKPKFYDVRRLLREHPNAYYYITFGERSSGKTYSALDMGLENYAKGGEQFAYVRRMGEDVKRKEMLTLFSAHIKNGVLKKHFGTQWDDIGYYAGAFYLIRHEKGPKGNATVEVKDDTPFCYVFSINQAQHFKSLSYPSVTTVVFDEFMSRTGYLPNEFVEFSNLLSTIIRHRNNVKIFMLGNTVNRYCPYFTEMGLKHVKDQKPGTVDLYTYGEKSRLQVVVEYTESAQVYGGKDSDVYFAFDNPELRMITRGEWEIAVYPRLKKGHKRSDVVQDFFIQFDGDIVHGEIVVTDADCYLFFYPKDDNIERDDDIVYTTSAVPRWNYRMALTKQNDKLSMKIRELMSINKAFYSSNECGEIVRNYLKWSTQYSIIK